MENKVLEFIENENIDKNLVAGVKKYIAETAPADEEAGRIPSPICFYYGKEVWEQALSALLSSKNLLLTGPKATGKNIFAENLSALFERPLWNVSFHVGTDASYLVGTDTFDGDRVVFRKGPMTLASEKGGFVVLDEINMAKNEALSVMHSCLDHRRVMDIPGYRKVDIVPAARFIGTMNYGYAGTRELNEALCSRFVVLEMPVIGENDLGRLLRFRFPGLKDNMVSQFSKLFYELNRKAEKGEISERALDLRGLLDAIDMMALGTGAGAALDMCIANKTFDPYERELVRDVIKARIPGDLRAENIFDSTVIA
ncbi:MAG: MoxR family ATPase [Lachnospiraceae bacterium]|nr:MoxR family ATPase [Lachnospiraceae bacterium]